MIVAGFDVGGKNIHGVIRGFVDSLKREIGMEVMVPADPVYIAALGAAATAATGCMDGRTEVQIVEKDDTFDEDTRQNREKIIAEVTKKQVCRRNGSGARGVCRSGRRASLGNRDPFLPDQ